MKISQNPTENNQPSSSRKAVGITTGLCIGLAPTAIRIKNLVTPMSDAKIEKKKVFMSKMIKEISSFENIKKYADSIIKETALKNNGLKIQIVKTEAVKKLLPPSYKPKTFWQKISDNMRYNRNKTFSNGLNACFNFNKNTVIINDKRLYSAAFHEIGHGLTYNSKKLKFLQLVRIFNQLTLPIFSAACLGVGLLTSKKSSKHNEPGSKNEKTTDFIHKNAGKLTFLYFTPVLAEEGLATVRGLNLAKKYLTPFQHKLHIRNQTIAFCSYLYVGLISALAVGAAIMAKDKIVQNKKSD